MGIKDYESELWPDDESYQRAQDAAYIRKMYKMLGQRYVPDTSRRAGTGDEGRGGLFPEGSPVDTARDIPM